MNPAVGFVLALALPWLIVRGIAIPMGWPKLAWLLSRVSVWVWRRDIRGAAVVAAAWALLRQPEPSAESIAWVERRRDAASESPSGARWQTSGAVIVATGLLAAVRGDHRIARRLLTSAGELAPTTCPPRCVALASEWLCADALERGEWRELEFIARTAAVDTRTLGLLASVAARTTGVEPVPSDLALRLRWLISPNRRSTHALLTAALAMPATLRPRRESKPAPLVPLVSDSPTPLSQALAMHAAMLAVGDRDLRVDHIVSVTAAWDRALASADSSAHVLERSIELGCRSDSVLRTLADQIEADLAQRIRSARVPLAALRDSTDFGSRLAGRIHGELLDGLEIASQSFESRVAAKRPLPAIDEWQAFLGLREQHAEAVALAGGALRRLGFSQLHGPMCSLAVWLWNDRSERALGNAIFQWLLNEAIVVDDAEAIRLQERNVACGI